MPKKIHVPDPSASAIPDEGLLLARHEHLELVRLECAIELALARQQAATAQDRAVRLEIEKAAHTAAEALRNSQEAFRQAGAKHKAFAESLAERYHFDWMTHTYCPETGRVRRVSED